MDEELDNKLGMARRVKTFLEEPANKAIWHDKPPLRFTARSVELYTAIGTWATMGAEQSVSLKGSADQQNIYEKALEDAAFPLANALHEFYLDHKGADDAAAWDLTLTDWRRMREQALLGKGELLITKLTEVKGAADAGEYGITTASIDNLTEKADDYGDAIGQPTARRAARTGKTKMLEPSWRKVRDILESMDNLVVQFSTEFVNGWFAARRIDDRGAGGKKEAPTA